MYGPKSIKLYFFSILKLSFLTFRNYYLRSNYYNKKLIAVVPSRIFYNPSSYLTASVAVISGDLYKITETSPKLLWQTNPKEKHKFEMTMWDFYAWMGLLWLRSWGVCELW